MKDTLVLNSDIFRLLQQIKNAAIEDDFSSFNNILTPIFTLLSCLLVLVSLVLLNKQNKKQSKDHEAEIERQKVTHKEQMSALREQHTADNDLMKEQIRIQHAQIEKQILVEKYETLKKDMTDIKFDILFSVLEKTPGLKIEKIDADKTNAINFYWTFETIRIFLTSTKIYKDFISGRLGHDTINENEEVFKLSRVTCFFFLNQVHAFHLKIHVLIDEIYYSKLQENEKQYLNEKVIRNLLSNYIYMAGTEILIPSRNQTLSNSKLHFDMFWNNNYVPESVLKSLNFYSVYDSLVERGLVQN